MSVGKHTNRETNVLLHMISNDHHNHILMVFVSRTKNAWNYLPNNVVVWHTISTPSHFSLFRLYRSYITIMGAKLWVCFRKYHEIQPVKLLYYLNHTTQLNTFCQFVALILKHTINYDFIKQKNNEFGVSVK